MRSRDTVPGGRADAGHHTADIEDADEAWRLRVLLGDGPPDARAVPALAALEPLEEASSATQELMSLSRAMTAIVADTLADLDDTLTVPQLRVLVMLSTEAAAGIAAVAACLGADRSHASHSCDRLVEAGLVRRVADPTDRHRVGLSLTARGRDLVDSVMQRRRRILDDLVGRLSPSERRALVRGVTALNRVMEDGGARAAVLRASILPWIR
jgi:DNA-binding MarR family transcriptional regulator